MFVLPAALLPVVSFAQIVQDSGAGATFLIRDITLFLNNQVVPFIFAIAFVVFIWGMFKTFILGGSDPDKQKEGRDLMIYAVLGFVIMVSLWGVVNYVARGFGFQGDTVNQIPDLPLGNN